jgi:hypothetical protein
LDSATAKAFERIAPWVVADDLLPTPHITGISFDTYLVLQENDLIIPGGSLSKSFGNIEGSVFNVVTLSNKVIAISKPIKIDGYKITKSGTELLKLLVAADASDSVKIIANHILERNGQFLAIGDLPNAGSSDILLYKYPQNSDHLPPEGVHLSPDGSIHLTEPT